MEWNVILTFSWASTQQGRHLPSSDCHQVNNNWLPYTSSHLPALHVSLKNSNSVFLRADTVLYEYIIWRGKCQSARKISAFFFWVSKTMISHQYDKTSNVLQHLTWEYRQGRHLPSPGRSAECWPRASGRRCGLTAFQIRADKSSPMYTCKWHSRALAD